MNQKKAEMLLNTLPMIEGDYNFDEDEFGMVKPTAKLIEINGNPIIQVSCENGDMAGDYYNDYINPKLVEWAKKNNTYWEWYDAGSIVASI